jgi:hypothetical protein
MEQSVNVDNLQGGMKFQVSNQRHINFHSPRSHGNGTGLVCYVASVYNGTVVGIYVQVICHCDTLRCHAPMNPMWRRKPVLHRCGPMSLHTLRTIEPVLSLLCGLPATDRNIYHVPDWNLLSPCQVSSQHRHLCCRCPGCILYTLKEKRLDWCVHYGHPGDN